MQLPVGVHVAARGRTHLHLVRRVRRQVVQVHLHRRGAGCSMFRYSYTVGRAGCSGIYIGGSGYSGTAIGGAGCSGISRVGTGFSGTSIYTVGGSGCSGKSTV